MRRIHALTIACGVLAGTLTACSGTTSTTSTTSQASSSTAPRSTTSPTSPGQPATWTAVWPTTSSTTRYRTPQAAAQGFATDYLHMVDPVLSPFQAGDGRSGEVPIRSTATGPITTAMVRQLGTDSSWWVLGAATPNIALTQPTWASTITSPVPLAGSCMAFEGTVQVQVREDGNSTPIGKGFVTGGAMGMEPFDDSLTFTRASTPYGAVVAYATSAADGSITEATVVRIRFG